MCPDVIWDAGAGLYRMWYSGGDQNEPVAIGHAVSRDGIHWSRARADLRRRLRPCLGAESGDRPAR